MFGLVAAVARDQFLSPVRDQAVPNKAISVGINYHLTKSLEMLDHLTSIAWQVDVDQELDTSFRGTDG